MKRNLIRSLWLADIGLLILLLLASMFADLNGAYPGLSTIASIVSSLLLIFTGIIVNLYLIRLDSRRRLLAIMLLAIFVAFGFPILI